MPTGTAPVDGPACLTPEQAVQWATTMLRPGVALVIGISIPTGSAAATEIAVEVLPTPPLRLTIEIVFILAHLLL